MQLLKEESKKALKEIVESAVAAAIKGQNFWPPKTKDPDLLAHRGCFVTLKTGGRLRGCIGVFAANKPLEQLACEMAFSAAKDDPRFESDRLTPDDIEDIDVEISVLSEMVKTDDPLSLELGKHGIYIKRGWQSGCFLPQVATESGWSKEEFLSYCCEHKAGLSKDAWKDETTDVFLFTAEIID
jgi:AmmeMemoRadiSam system protein A